MRTSKVALSRTMLVKERDLTVTAPSGVLKSARAIAELMRETAEAEAVECCWVVLLDARRKPLQVVEVSRGTLTQSLAHPREVFRAAITGNAAGLAFLHNHPSGDPSPSADDHALTRRLRECGELLAMPVVDSIILGGEGQYFSYAKQGWPRA